MRIVRILAVGLASAAVVGLAAAPAAADPTGGTGVTFEITGATLDIVVPAAADLGGTGAPGTALSGLLGLVTVTDGRASADASWVTTATSTNFTTGAAGPTETILATELDYWSGAATATTGTGTFTPAQPTAPDAEALDATAPLTVFTHTGGTGNNTASWNPTLVVNIPLDAEAGTYTGTVTHSVA